MQTPPVGPKKAAIIPVWRFPLVILEWFKHVQNMSKSSKPKNLPPEPRSTASTVAAESGTRLKPPLLCNPASGIYGCSSPQDWVE